MGCVQTRSYGTGASTTSRGRARPRRTPGTSRGGMSGSMIPRGLRESDRRRPCVPDESDWRGCRAFLPELGLPVHVACPGVRRPYEPCEGTYRHRGRARLQSIGGCFALLTAGALAVRQLARKIGIAPVTLSRYWRSEVPLKCGPKQLLSWAMHFWALRQRSEAGWDANRQPGGGGASYARTPR